MKIFLVLTLFLFFCKASIAAEVLQVTSASQLLIGDHNRTYKVELACINIDPKKGNKARIWLKDKLPRGRHVNLMPIETKNGVLFARVKSLNSEKELSYALSEQGFGNYSCVGFKNS